MKRSRSKITAALVGIGLFALGSGAQAGELTVALNGEIQTFSVAPGLYYSQNLGAGFGVNASFEGKYTLAYSPAFYLGLGLSVQYTLPVLRAEESYLEAFANTGFVYSLLENRGDPFVGVGLNGSYKFAYNARVYGADTLQLAFDTRFGEFRPILLGYVGGQFDPISSVNLYAQLDYALNFNPGLGRGFRYDASLKGDYEIVPNLKAGLTVGSRSEDPWYAILGIRYLFKL
jgi:hypothetical protein